MIAQDASWVSQILGPAAGVLGIAATFGAALWGVARMVAPSLREETRAAVRAELDAQLEVFGDTLERRHGGIDDRLERLEARFDDRTPEDHLTDLLESLRGRRE